MEGGKRANDVPTRALNVEFVAFVWRILGDSSHALRVEPALVTEAMICAKRDRSRD